MEMYKVLFYGGLILAILFLLATVILFFVLKIPKVIGDLTGSTQRKSIEAIRRSGYESKSKQDAIHDETSRITVHDSSDPETGTLDQKTTSKGADRTPNRASASRYREDDYDSATEILGSENYDSDLDDSTEILRDGSDDDEATDILKSRDDSSFDADDATDILTSDGEDEEDEVGVTDVLTTDASEEEVGTTAVLTAEDQLEDLKTAPKKSEGFETADDDAETSDEEKEHAEEATSVLSSMNIAGNITAADGSDDTMVLTEAHAKGSGMNRIKTVYAVTVVHTKEVL